MEIILLENILNLGNIGDKVTVKNGYGRNFLLKQGKALLCFVYLRAIFLLMSSKLVIFL